MRKPLVVLVPGYKGDATYFKDLKAFLAKQEGFENVTWIDFNYKKPLWSNADPEVIARNLSSTIDNYFSVNKAEITEIILAGHSMGTTLLRRAFLNSSGYGIIHTRQDWVSHVSRIVLMGGISRGVIVEKFPFFTRIALKVLVKLARLFGFGKMRLNIFKGGDFISRLRIDWIRFNNTRNFKTKVVHLLGARDEISHPDDVIDLDQFPNAVPIEVANVGHRQIIFPGENTSTPLFRAFIGEPKTNRDITVNKTVKKIFFFLHGIRDSRTCFENVANKLKETYPDAKVIVPTYGYLTARGFLSTKYRNSFVPWFVDQFTEYLAEFPNAEFYFAGHSNGTYILGESLRRIPGIVFKRIYLAGTVLPPNYKWKEAIDEFKQTQLVRSDMGITDTPVGVLCRILNRWGIKSIGPGGVDEFEYQDKDHFIYKKYKGGHSAMLADDNTDSIVNFLLHGKSTKKRSQSVKAAPLWFTFLLKFGDILLFVIMLALIYSIFTFPFPQNLILPLLIWVFLGRL